jgi:hypothetical protein
MNHHQFQVRPLPTIAWKHELYSWHHLALNFHSMDPDVPFPFTAGWLLLTHNQMSLRHCSTVQMKKHLILNQIAPASIRKLHPTAIGRVRTSQSQTAKIYLFSSYLWSLPPSLFGPSYPSPSLRVDCCVLLQLQWRLRHKSNRNGVHVAASILHSKSRSRQLLKVRDRRRERDDPRLRILDGRDSTTNDEAPNAPTRTCCAFRQTTVALKESLVWKHE